MNIIRDLGLQTMTERREFLTSVLMFKCIYGLAPNYLSDSLVYTHEVHSRLTRSTENNNLYIPKCNIEIFKRSFQYQGPTIWNDIPIDIKQSATVHQFKVQLKQWLVGRG